MIIQAGLKRGWVIRRTGPQTLQARLDVRAHIVVMESPRPFDRDRDGLVIGEGAGTLVLEEYEHAKARGATIYAEIAGFGTNSDGKHVTQPTAETMEKALRLALEDAGVSPNDIDFVNGHGTATDRGDVAESQATAAVFGQNVPYHTLKGHFGQTLGACGVIETWLGIEMMRSGWFPPIANLTNRDPLCGELDYVTDQRRHLDVDVMMLNNFAFGGINTSVIIKKP
ncbi:beta-ketoacyl synthase N-terminal-like domain-containing protein [Roseovarius sp. EL26]|uniref:beta-ketoacyl synthase N-terminal-like domain-containing protein n=1 Tax=Roseovarius sp. EL26 TaxID=2126672 RepID=UPI0020B1295D|nr:beta-ketoacyl synthase N-terminal-like domain-containing protein [Roseovarius sp. EL26]